MRTSALQFRAMVEFMEKHGDLNKLRGGPQSRQFVFAKWRELTKTLNSIYGGNVKSKEQWSKVWSDFKNNSKRKMARMKRATSAGDPMKLTLTNLERRVLRLLGYKTCNEDTHEEEVMESSLAPDFSIQCEPLTEKTEVYTIICDAAETSGLASPPDPPKPEPTTKSHEEIIKETVAELILEADRNGRDYGRQRDRVDVDLERERLRQRDEELRLRDYELRERVRQRDVELQLQGKWLDFMKEAMNLLVRHINK